MVFLTRTVRFAVQRAGSGSDASSVNGYGGSPSLEGLGAHYEVDVTCVGEPEPVTGYLVNIRDIDVAVRERMLPVVLDAYRSDPQPDAFSVLRAGAEAVADALPVRVDSVAWRLTPTHSLEHRMQTPTRAIIRQSFDFSASHRLHADALSAEENRRVFGKCNNPSGHGHNYRVEPSVEVDTSDPRCTLPVLERLTDLHVIDRFDHKHLNIDTVEFGPEGVIASVENIARVCFDLLAAPLSDVGGRLLSVRVWETDRTSASYPASPLSGPEA